MRSAHTTVRKCSIKCLPPFANALTSGQVEAVMKAFAPVGFEQCRPNAKKMKQSALVALGPDAEWSLDGHDKLMEAGFGIYGIRDKWSGRFLYYVVMPSNRFTAAVGVVYLRCARKIGGRMIYVLLFILRDLPLL